MRTEWKFRNLFFFALRSSFRSLEIFQQLSTGFSLPARTNLERMEEGANPGGKLIDVSPPFSNGIKDLRRQTNRFYNLYSFIEAFTAAIPLLPSLGQMVRPRFRSVYALESGNKISCGIYLSIRRV